MRIADEFIKKKIGFYEIYNNLNPISSPGKDALRNFIPFNSGEEKKLETVYLKTSSILSIIKQNNHLVLLSGLENLKNCDVLRDNYNEWGPVELSIILDILTGIDKISHSLKILNLNYLWEINFPTEKSLKIINDSFSSGVITDDSGDLGDLSKECKTVEKKWLDAENREREKIAQKLKVRRGQLRSLFTVENSNLEMIKILDSIKEMRVVKRGTSFRKYRYEPSLYVTDIIDTLNNLRKKRSDIEKSIIKKVAEELAESLDGISDALNVIGDIDLNFSRAIIALENDLNEPLIVNSTGLRLKNCINPVLENYCKINGFIYQKISMETKSKIMSLTGSNMGGKSAFLKTVALNQILVQYGLMVKSEVFQTVLYDYIRWVGSGDDDVVRGLSSFGKEIVNLVNALKLKGSLLLLVDEFASSTNFEEGTALLHGLVNFLKTRKTGMTIIAGHTKEISKWDGVEGFETYGLDYEKLQSKDKKDPITIISESMNYGIKPYSGERSGDAIAIAGMLGIPADVLSEALRYK